MLLHTFCHIHGIGHSTEKRLWGSNILTWDDLLANTDMLTNISEAEIRSMVKQSKTALHHDPSFFVKHLKTADLWRLFPHFREQAAYLDIETTGLALRSEITTIALYDGIRVRTYVNGRNLEAFLGDLEPFTLLITYNGVAFDIPVIESYFRTKLAQAQLDLRYVLARLGCRGGLKECERQMGIYRGTLDGIDGGSAVALWREYERHGDEAALETLLAYNVEDTVNLERLMVEAYNRNVEATCFGADLQLPYPDPPQLMHHADPSIIGRMVRYGC